MSLYARIEHGAVVDQLRLSAEELVARQVNGEDWRPVRVVEPTAFPTGAQRWKVTMTVLDDEVEFQDDIEEPTAEEGLALRAAQRRAAYLTEGINLETMIVALWERIVENRPQATQALQAKREAVKGRLP